MEAVKTQTETGKDTEMETPATVLQLLKPRLNILSELAQTLPDPDYICDLCKDSGRIYFTEEHFGKKYESHKKCVCVLENIRRKKLSAIPPKFEGVLLSALKPDVRKHARQAEYIPFIQANPTRSYFLGGKFGTGKTMMMWALYRDAVERDRRTVVCTLTELLTEYKKAINASTNHLEPFYPRLVAEDLRQNHTKFSIFLDDVDKAKPTEYVAEQVFELANAIYDFQHQIVITTNLSVKGLGDYFERADERYGGAIVRRFVDNSKVCEMF